MTPMELAERCEKASGPDRELDAEIARGLGWKEVPNPTFAGGLVGRWHRPDGSMTGHEGPPKFTASLDAAMTLVPEGFYLSYLTECHEDELPQCCLTESIEPARDFVSRGVDLPLSVCAAALRARAHQESQP